MRISLIIPTFFHNNTTGMCKYNLFRVLFTSIIIFSNIKGITWLNKYSYLSTSIYHFPQVMRTCSNIESLWRIVEMYKHKDKRDGEILIQFIQYAFIKLGLAETVFVKAFIYKATPVFSLTSLQLHMKREQKCFYTIFHIEKY